MEAKNELKEIDITNCRCYFFDDIMSNKDFYSGNIFLHEKSHKAYENILLYDISYKTFISVKVLRVRLDEMDEFMKIYDEIRFLVLLDCG